MNTPLPQPLKAAILSLGCPRNLVDSENILSRLNSCGTQITDIQDADVAIVNTCAFIEDAKRESIEAILDLIELKKQHKLKKVIVAGCLSQRYGKNLLPQFKDVDAFVGRLSLNDFKRNYFLTPRHYAYLKISEGCRNNCSYCVIPKIKGAFRSRPIDSIIQEVKILDEKGIIELNLIGQDISLYGIDCKGLSLTKLLKELVKSVRNIRWLRLLYLHPKHINAELIDLLKDEPAICKYIDLPIQHINDRILKRMNRGINRKEIISLLELLRKKIPQVAIRTSVITGFPGETENEFSELLDFIKEAKFQRLGAFIYSREEGTPAYNFKPQVPQKTKLRRLDMLMKTQQEISSQINTNFMGQEMEVLIEERDSPCENQYLGRTQFDAPEVDGQVYVKSTKLLRNGDIVKVKIVDTYEYDLVGSTDDHR